MDDEGALFDSAFDDTGPFRVSPESGGVSLESALRDFGPAAIDDLIPRLRVIARRLDAAHRDGIVHGALHPSKVIITDDRTTLVAGKGPQAPYAAPEVLDGYDAAPVSDQYALAAITYEWLFGRPVPSHSHRPLNVRTMPGVDRAALTAALTRALAVDPDDRFPSCGEFCEAVAGAVVPELPLLSDADDFSPEEAPIAAADLTTPIDDPFLVLEEPVEDVELMEETETAESDVDTIDSERFSAEPVAVPSWNPSATSSQRTESPRFGAVALFFAVLVGAVFGFAAGYMARPRALQSGPPQTIASAAGTDAAVAPVEKSAREAPKSAEPPKIDAPKAPEAKAPEAKAAEAPKAPETPVSGVGSLLVRSTPAGASVSVDGMARGVTPLALRSLDIGTRTVVIARRGFIPETRKVVITKARPARTLDVRLAASASAAAGPSGGTSPKLANQRSSEGGPKLAKPRASVGGLTVDSRPAGAAVTINGKASGNTPLTLNDLPPGEYRILIVMPGYREFATTVRVVAGERARAAASLTALVEH